MAEMGTHNITIFALQASSKAQGLAPAAMISAVLGLRLLTTTSKSRDR
jgi:hypothetical protein